MLLLRAEGARFFLADTLLKITDTLLSDRYSVIWFDTLILCYFLLKCSVSWWPRSSDTLILCYFELFSENTVIGAVIRYSDTLLFSENTVIRAVIRYSVIFKSSENTVINITEYFPPVFFFYFFTYVKFFRLRRAKNIPIFFRLRRAKNTLFFRLRRAKTTPIVGVSLMCKGKKPAAGENFEVFFALEGDL